MEIDGTGKGRTWDRVRCDRTAEDRTSYITCQRPMGISEEGQGGTITHSMALLSQDFFLYCFKYISIYLCPILSIELKSFPPL